MKFSYILLQAFSFFYDFKKLGLPDSRKFIYDKLTIYLCLKQNVFKIMINLREKNFFISILIQNFNGSSKKYIHNLGSKLFLKISFIALQLYAILHKIFSILKSITVSKGWQKR